MKPQSSVIRQQIHDARPRADAPTGGRRFLMPPRKLECRRSGQLGTVPVMTADEFVPVGFEPPTSLTTDQFRLEPLGPRHNQADHAAWMSSIEHIRSTPGFPATGHHAAA
jgi:hypothetical protein